MLQEYSGTIVYITTSSNFLYPKAKVLLTVKDEARWDSSWQRVESLVWVLDRIAAVFIPPVKWRVTSWLVPLLWGKDGALYHELGDGFSNIAAYRQLSKNGSQQTVFKEGCAPICKMLDVVVPDEPFPFANAGMTGIWRKFGEKLWKHYTMHSIAVLVLQLAILGKVTTFF